MEFLLHNNDLENRMLALAICPGATASLYLVRMVFERRLAKLSRRRV